MKLTPILAAALLAAPAGADEPTGRRILFGDLHTHSNLSMDAMLMMVFQGQQRGPEEACTYARACAQVDFYGQSDHAEMLHRAAWERSVAAVRACNDSGLASAGPGGEPDIVAFQGFEWTSSQKDLYWGHKNVFFANDVVPEMPVAAYPLRDTVGLDLTALFAMIDIYRREGITFMPAVRSSSAAARLQRLGNCAAPDADPDMCVRVADRPSDLWAVLNGYYGRPGFGDHGYDAIAIPHGTAWGMAKLAADWRIQLDPMEHDANLQRLVEVYSGHGNSEEYRDFDRPDSGYESCRTRAARLERAWCRRQGGDVGECDARAAHAHDTVRVSFATTPDMWGRCGECPDCFQPAERYQPQGSVQAGMAMSGFAADGTPQTRFNFGFIAATDDHNSRPASVQEKKALTDWAAALGVEAATHTPFIGEPRNAVEAERIASYLYPGGLVAVHAAARSRAAIWDALKRREVYGTSGPRIELWFDGALGAQRAPMGGRLQGAAAPQFTVEAQGAPEELPGCAAATRARFGDDVIENACLGTCYNPGNRRSGVERVEIVKITPQARPGEPLGGLIRDPWRTIRNESRLADGRPAPRLTATFSDPEFAAEGRDALYYVRVVQEATPAVNGVPMTAIDGSPRVCPVRQGDDCLSLTEERAWSSPIFVDWRGGN